MALRFRFWGVGLEGSVGLHFRSCSSLRPTTPFSFWVCCLSKGSHAILVTVRTIAQFQNIKTVQTLMAILVIATFIIVMYFRASWATEARNF